MKTHFLLLGLPLALTLSACAVVPTAVNVAKIGDVDDSIALFEAADALAPTADASMPTTGSATYTGTMSNLTDSDHIGLIGDMTVRADFTSNEVSGGVENISFILVDPDGDFDGDLDGFKNNLLDGELTISNGVIAGNTMAGDMTGTLGAGLGDLGELSIDADMDISGNFLSSDPGTADADVIQGGMVGGFEMTISSDDPDFDGESGDAEFYEGDVGFTVCTSDCGTLLNP